MKIAFIGIGNVGFALADNLQKIGHQIIVANDNSKSESALNALSKNSEFVQRGVQSAIDESEVIFLATPFGAAKSAIEHADFKGKVLVDCTNPVGPGMKHGLNSEQSGAEFIQKVAATANVVKAFTIYGFENFIDSKYPGYEDLNPAMLICGNDISSKQTVSLLCKDLGWESVDTGDISQSLHLEHMTLLWIKMARIQGMGSDFVWAMLKR